MYSNVTSRMVLPLALAISGVLGRSSVASLTNYWSFDQNPNDEVGGQTGTLMGSPAHVSTPWGMGYSFDGDDFITTDFVPMAPAGSSMTWSVRFKMASDAPDAIMEVFGLERSNHQEIRLFVRGDLGGEVVSSFRDDDWRTSKASAGGDWRDDQWHHAVCVRDGAAQRVRLYMDGRLLCERSSPTSDINVANARTLDIGADNNSTFGHQNLFHGVIDELRVYDEALTYAEVLNLSIPDLAHYWSFENGVDDVVGGSTSINHGAAAVESIWGIGYEFGDGQFVETDLVPQLAPGDSISIAAWVRPSSNGPAAPMDVCGLERSDHQEIRLMIRPDLDGAGQASFRDDNHVPSSALSPPGLDDDAWHHLVAVRDGDAGIIRLYVDGTLADETASAPGPINISSARTLDIGADNNSTFGHQYFFHGIIDEARIYHRALSPMEAAAFVPRPPCPGDLSCDGIVGVEDLALVLAHFGSPNSASSGDADLDGDADPVDLAIVLANWGNECP